MRHQQILTLCWRTFFKQILTSWITFNFFSTFTTDWKTSLDQRPIIIKSASHWIDVHFLNKYWLHNFTIIFYQTLYIYCQCQTFSACIIFPIFQAFFCLLIKVSSPMLKNSSFASLPRLFLLCCQCLLLLTYSWKKTLNVKSAFRKLFFLCRW